MPALSAYEQFRKRNVARNARLFTELGLANTAKKVLPETRKSNLQSRQRKRKRAEPLEPLRKSTRVRGKPPVSYVPPDPVEERDDARAERRQQQKKGYRLANGKWRGERFGHVPGVPVGTVFGAGDYQRKGRREMADTGFFEPFVTPEWVERNGACYSIILNNDNGLSSDGGDIVQYAGAGGRLRGQNRTAPQSFSQTFDSTTNKALKLNCERKLPVRVIRGPKLKGKYSTAKCGGGYRYDGLYLVVKAELIKRGPRGLKTAMFTLQRKKDRK